MTFRNANVKTLRPVRAAMGTIATAVFIIGFLQTCDDRLIGLTRFIDPCATIFANCAPGDFEVNRADVGDFCVDPACTVPGQCGPGQALGTITDICP